MTDQQRGDSLSIDGHPDVRTPNLDSFAERGVYFRSAYTPCPICSPARRSILTGHNPATDGALDNSFHPIANPTDTLPNLLRLSGYQTAMVGRNMHQFPGYKRYGFEINDHDPFQEYYSTAHRDLWAAEANGRAVTGRSEKRGIHWPHLLEHSIHVDGFTTRPWPYPESYHETVFSVNKSIEFIDRRDRDDPFFLSVGFTAPHPPMIPPEYYFNRYRSRRLEAPVTGTWVDEYFGEAIEALPSGPGGGRAPRQADLMDDAMAAYYGSIQHIDDQVYRLVQRIQREGEPTYIFFTSDHGEQLGDHGLFRKCRPYQGTLRVPFFCFSVGCDDLNTGKSVEQAVSLTDLYPTLCDLLGVEYPSHVEGASLEPVIRGDGGLDREYVHSEIRRFFEHGGFHVLVGQRYKYIWFSDSGRELFFDLAEDPRELENRVSDSRHGERIAAMRAELAARLSERPEGFSDGRSLVAGCTHEAIVR